MAAVLVALEMTIKQIGEPGVVRRQMGLIPAERLLTHIQLITQRRQRIGVETWMQLLGHLKSAQPVEMGWIEA